MSNATKTPTRFALALCALLLCAWAARAQEAAPAEKPAAPWVSVSPEGEEFVVKMPRAPAPAEVRASAGGAFVSGRRYEVAGDDSSTYAVWSLTFTGAKGSRLLPDEYEKEGAPAGEAFLDAVADFAWDSIVVPELEEAARRNEKPFPSASFIRFFDLGPRRAREYRMWLRERGGPVYVYSDGLRAYVVTAFGPDPQSPALKQFVESFGMKTASPPTPVTIKVDPALSGGGAKSAGPGYGNGMGTGMGTGMGPGAGTGAGTGAGVGGGATKDNAGAPVDYSRPFKPGDVTKKAVLTAKPEPGFTESARKFNVAGTVRLRAVLSASGKVERIYVVKWLPHGLTERAIAAAKQIRFTPAQKDGLAVSQYVTLEYNFNIY